MNRNEWHVEILFRNTSGLLDHQENCQTILDMKKIDVSLVYICPNDRLEDTRLGTPFMQIMQQKEEAG